MATNKHPWIRNIFGASKPLIFKGLVQAGSTATMKKGEICTYNETSGYFTKADAAADALYSLAIANEEQKSSDLERYIEFIGIREGDVFEFALAAAAQLEIGDGYEISDSQTLATDPDGNAIAYCCGDQNYPQSGTTLEYVSYGEFMFLPEVSYIYKNMLPRATKVVKAKTSAYTLIMEDIGAVITNKGATGSVTITAPDGTVPIGWFFYLAVMADQTFVFEPNPQTASVYIKGDAQTAGKYVSMTDIGDFAMLLWDGSDWLAVNSISGADGDISVES